MAKEASPSHRANKSKKSMFSSFKKRKTPNTPEEKVNSSSAFWVASKKLHMRIPSTHETRVFRETMEALNKYISLHKSKRVRLKELETKLEKAIKENDLEMFDIREIPSLGKSLYRVKGHINRLSELQFPDFYCIEDVPISDGISYSIYAGSAAFIASQHFIWGKVYTAE